jgi:hypothetical protein
MKSDQFRRYIFTNTYKGEQVKVAKNPPWGIFAIAWRKYSIIHMLRGNSLGLVQAC